jgi:hypothetical protein
MQNARRLVGESARAKGFNCAIMVCIAALVGEVAYEQWFQLCDHGVHRCSRRKKKFADEHADVQSCSAERKYVASHTRNTPTATLRCSWRSDIPFVGAVAGALRSGQQCQRSESDTVTLKRRICGGRCCGRSDHGAVERSYSCRSMTPMGHSVASAALKRCIDEWFAMSNA